MKKFRLSFCCEVDSTEEIILQIELLNSKNLCNETSAISLIGSGANRSGINRSGGNGNGGDGVSGGNGVYSGGVISFNDGYANSNQLNDNNYFDLSSYYFYIFVDVSQGQINETTDFLYIIEDDKNIPLYRKECDQNRM